MRRVLKLGKKSVSPRFAAAMAALGLAVPVMAVDGTWNTDAGAGNLNWSNASNWLDGNIADGVGAVANFTFDITAARTVTIDGAGSGGSRTLGILNVGDPVLSAGGPHNYTITRNNSNVLNLDNTAATAAQINLLSNSTSGLSVSTALNLLDNVIVSNNSPSSNLSISGAIAGTGNITLNNNGTGTMTLSTTSLNVVGSITNAGTGTGTVTLSAVLGANVTGVVQNSDTTQLTLSGANNSYTGGVTLNAGILSLGNGSALGATASTLTINGGTIAGTSNQVNNNAQVWNGNFDYTSGGINLGGGAVTVNGDRTVTNLGSGTLTVGGTVGGNGSLTLVTNVGSSSTGFNFSGGINLSGSFGLEGQGSGVVTVGTIGANVTNVTHNGLQNLTFIGSNASTGPVAINTGQATLDFNNAAAPASNILNSNSALVIGGTAFNVTGKASTTNSQTINGVTLNAGTNFAINNNATANPTVVALGAITRNTGATVNFSLANGSSAADNGWTSSTTNFGGWGTYASAGWATNNGTNIVALDPGSYTTNTWATGVNTNVAASNTVAANSTTGTLRFNGMTAGTTITLSGTNIIETGGILAALGGGTQNMQLTGGNLTSGTNELIVHQYITGATLTINSNIVDNTGPTSLTKVGGGTVTLGSTSNSFTGNIFINGTGAGGGTSSSSGGAIQISSDSNLGNINNDLRLTNNGQLTVAGNTVINPLRNFTVNGGARLIGSSGNGVVAGNITGNNGFNVGAGTFALMGNNAVSGEWSIGGGLIRMGSQANIGGANSAIRTNSGYFNTHGFSIIGTEVTNFTGHSFTYVGENLTFEILDPNNTFTWTNTYALGGNSASNSAFVKNGRGTFVVATPQTYVNSGTGIGIATELRGGVFKVDAAAGGSLGGGTVNNNNRIGFAGGTFHYLGKGGSESVTQNIGNLRLLAGGGTLIIDNANGSGTTTVNAGTLSGNFVASGTATAAAGSHINIRTINPGTGGVVLTTTETNTNGIVGAGRVTFNGTNFATNLSDTVGGTVGAYTGATVGLGENTLGSTTNFTVQGSATATGVVNANTIKFASTGAGQGVSLANQQMSLTTGGLLYVGADDYSINDGAIRSINTTNSDLIIHQYGAGSLSIGAIIQNNSGGTSTLTKTGTGTLILTGVNTYTGQTYINDGVISIAANNQLGSAQVNLNGGTLAITGSFMSNRTHSLGGNGGTFDVASGQAFTIAGGGLSGAGQASLNGGGTLTLNTANTFTGGMVIENGTVRGNAANFLGANGLNPLKFGGGSTAKLQLNAFSANVTQLTGGANAVVENSHASTAATLGVHNATNDSFAGTLQNGGVGTLGLTKGGMGTLTLTGTNTYTGATLVANGTLRVNGSLGNTAVAVSSSGVLAGTGTIAGNVTVNAGGTLQPGSGNVESLGTGALTFTGGKFAVEVNTASNTADQVVAGSDVALGDGLATLELSFLGNASGSYNHAYILIDNTTVNETTGYFLGMAPQVGKEFTFSAGGLSYVLDYAGGTGNDVEINFATVVVPEPASLSLLGLAGAGLLARRRRR